MKKIVAALLSLVAGSTALLCPQAAKADQVVDCHPITENQASRNSADNARAYAYGYREGEQSFRDGVPYKPRTAGGEFARGFEDGYFNRPYASQGDVGSNTFVQSTTQDCNQDRDYSVAPPSTVIYTPYVVAPPAVIYSAPYIYPNPIIDLNFGFGRRYYGWGRYGRW
ncbi:MAG: hypothetical protein JO235_02250 [Chroococcidiopsidaceae cyanobacterium CP_BM_RX_35]|nr:hypothetical protein [Chroococcidiopsidaceae cyanobacterium CP_BM_RX_35]